jgi:hypothetical protein
MLGALMDQRLPGTVLLLATLVSCNTRPRERERLDPPGASILPTRTAQSAPSSSAVASAAASGSASADRPPASAAPPPRPGPPGDACRLTRGPIQLSLTGQATLWFDDPTPDRDPHIVFNRDGVPRVVTLPAIAGVAPVKNGKPGDPRKPERMALAEPAERATAPGCAVAGATLFCVDRGGGIHRTGLTAQDGTVVAQARAGAPIAATMMGGSHVVYAFLADRKTTEGALTLAFAALDDATPVTLSEDGSGATYVTLASRGEEALAMYVDARRVLTPVHARMLTFGAKLGLGPDAVIFVGGGTDGRTGGALAQGAGGSELALLALEKDEKGFGMAAVRVEEQPHDDAPVTWSLYPGAIDRAPLVATQGVWPIRVLRVRGAAADPNGKKVLELGELDAAGVFKALCPVAEGAGFGDLAIAADRAGALWIAYTDADGTWIERRGR